MNEQRMKKGLAFLSFCLSKEMMKNEGKKRKESDERKRNSHFAVKSDLELSNIDSPRA